MQKWSAVVVVVEKLGTLIHFRIFHVQNTLCVWFQQGDLVENQSDEDLKQSYCYTFREDDS